VVYQADADFAIQVDAHGGPLRVEVTHGLPSVVVRLAGLEYLDLSVLLP